MKNLLDSQISYLVKIRQIIPVASFRTPEFMINHLLKTMAFMAVFAAIQVAAPVQAAVNMISVERRVWGYAGVDGPARNYYNGTGSAPLSRSTSSGISGDYYYASSSASDWSVNAYAENGPSFGQNAVSNAQNTYVFKPFYRELSILLNGVIGVWWFENAAQMILTDLNTDTLVSIYQSPNYFYPNEPFFPNGNDFQDYPINWDMTVEVDPEHQYELIIYVGAVRAEGGSGSASLNLSLVPEPGTTLLAGMAAVFMCGRRHRPLATR